MLAITDPLLSYTQGVLIINKLSSNHSHSDHPVHGKAIRIAMGFRGMLPQENAFWCIF